MSDTKTANNGASATQNKADVRVINNLEIGKDQDVLIVNEATIALLDKAFVMQDAYDNESKFRRKFVLDCVRGGIKAECSRLIAAWDSAIAKVSKLHPLQNREQNIATLLESKKARELKAMVDVAASLKRELS